MNKPILAIYAICKNEQQFVQRWLESMWNNGNGADYICVLDTGSDDNTVTELFKVAVKLGIPEDRLIVKVKAITPWRFDVARNESMKLIPSDKQVSGVVCTDLDEILIPDFWDDFRDCITKHPNFNRIFYRYAWGHNASGDPTWVFWYDKTHQNLPGWHWDYPVHETLAYSGDISEFEGSYYLDSDKIYLHHWPDATKSRSSYLGLLEQRRAEYPDDIYGIYYLAREYSFVNNYVDAVTTMTNLYVRCLAGVGHDDMNMGPCIHMCLGNFYNRLGDKQSAEYWYSKGIRENPTFRPLYIAYASFLGYSGRPKESNEILEDMEKKSIYLEDWRYTVVCTRLWKVNQIKAVNACWSREYEKARELFDEAEKDIQQHNEVELAMSEGFYGDVGWLNDYQSQKEKREKVE